MFEIFADTRRLRVCKKEKITTTSAGINCLVKFSTDYVGHAIKLVFQINGKRWTVETQYNADGSTIRIPNDCFLPTTSPAWSPLNCELTCALRGEYIVEGGTTVTSRLPTVFTSMGIVEQGYDDAGAMTETAPTPTQVTQLETLVANCLSSAQMYTNMASNSATSAATSAALAANYTRRLSNMTVNAVGTSAGSTPTVTVSVVGGAYNFKFGIPKGETGATGPQGPAGADGRDGVDGADGIQGPQGPMGPAGRDGRDGTDGTNGRDGIDGQDGRDGVDGATGPQGPAGPTGPTGPEGPQGPQGPQGPEGPIKVTYHIVYETEPSGYTNPTVTDVENWISDSSTVHLVRWKPADSTNYFDLTYTYSNQTYYYFCGASAQSRIIFARLRRSGSTAGGWSLSYVSLQKAGDTIFTSSNTFLATYNASDPTQNTPLADIEAANTAGLHVYLRYIGSSFFYICPTFRVSESTFYWYAIKQTDTLMYVALTRTGTSAGTWTTSTPNIQLTSGRVQTIVGNETEAAKYPSTKAVADYVDSKKDFRAYYDTTTWSEVNEAHLAVKDIYVYRNNLKHRLQYVYTLNDHNAYVFGLFYNGQWSRLTVNTDAEGSTTTWSSGSMSLQDTNYRKSTMLGNETSTTAYPNCKAVADYINELTMATVGNNETVIIPANKGYNVTILSGCSACTFNLQYNIYRRDAVVLIKALNDVNSLNFTTETGRTIVWASGTAPSIVSGHTYELSFRCFNSKVMCVWKDWGL